MQSGATLPSTLVHVSRHQFGAHVKYPCTCGVFKHINSDRLSARPEGSDSTGVSFQSTCAHCDFLVNKLKSTFLLSVMVMIQQQKCYESSLRPAEDWSSLWSKSVPTVFRWWLNSLLYYRTKVWTLHVIIWVALGTYHIILESVEPKTQSQEGSIDWTDSKRLSRFVLT